MKFCEDPSTLCIRQKVQLGKTDNLTILSLHGPTRQNQKCQARLPATGQSLNIPQNITCAILRPNETLVEAIGVIFGTYVDR